MLTIPQPEKGMHYRDLDTPCLLIDVEVFESNVAKMAAFMSQGTAALRPYSRP